MTDKTKKIIVREGLIFASILLIWLGMDNIWSPMRVAHYRKECQMLEKAQNIKTITIDYRLWGGVWDKTSWDNSKDPDVWVKPMVPVVDKDGRIWFMDKNKRVQSHPGFNFFDLKSARPVSELSEEELKRGDNIRGKNDEEIERLKKIYKSNEEKLKIAQQVVSLQGCYYNPPYNTVEGVIAIPIVLLVLAYPIYLFVRFIVFITWAIKTKKITKEKIINYTKIALSKEVLIRVILILGILFLSISLLKSCGFIKIHG